LVSNNTVAYVSWADLKVALVNNSFSLFTSVQNLTSSSMNILIQSNISNLISLLSVSYLLLNLQYPYQNYFTMIQVDKILNTSFITSFNVTVNHWYDTSGIQFGMINGLSFQYPYYESIQIDVYPIDNYNLGIKIYI
jgi:hypothetical protein